MYTVDISLPTTLLSSDLCATAHVLFLANSLDQFPCNQLAPMHRIHTARNPRPFNIYITRLSSNIYQLPQQRLKPAGRPECIPLQEQERY